MTKIVAMPFLMCMIFVIFEICYLTYQIVFFLLSIDKIQLHLQLIFFFAWNWVNIQLLYISLFNELTTFETTFLEKHISSQPFTMDIMFSSASSYVNMTTTGLVFIKQTITTKSESETSKIVLKISLRWK